MPPEAHWPRLKAQAKQPTMSQLADDVIADIEREHSGLKGVLPNDCYCVSRISWQNNYSTWN